MYFHLHVSMISSKTKALPEWHICIWNACFSKQTQDLGARVCGLKLNIAQLL